ncbi:MAG: histidinol-phosphate transaminase [Haloferacaceae archaeon]
MEPRDLSAHDPYVPGRGAEEAARELGVDPGDLIELSSNENPHGPAPAAVEAVREAAPSVSGYPKAAHADLAEAVADEWGVPAERVWLAAGADGALDYLARATIDPGDRVLAPDPGFAYYRMSARYHHGVVDTYGLSRADGFAQTPETVLSAYDDHRVVYLTTPHNPTGSEFRRAAVAEVAERVAPETLVVVDEAYGEFSDRPSAAGLLDDHGNVAVTRTFSKAYGLAGLRVGYALVPAAWADAYARVNTPFAVNELACRAAMAALEADDHLERSIESARRARERLRADLDARTWESGGNFVLADVGDAAAVAEAAGRRGVLVRDCTSFGLPACIRVSCGTREETREAVGTLNAVLREVEA